VSKAETVVGDLFNIGGDEGTGMSAHGRLFCTDLIPSQIIDHVHNQVWLLFSIYG